MVGQHHFSFMAIELDNVLSCRDHSYTCDLSLAYESLSQVADLYFY